MAEDVGFNANDDYQEKTFDLTGEDLLKAQSIWKEITARVSTQYQFLVFVRLRALMMK